MNWDAIGAIGEVVGGAAVIFTLVYLAIQVRNNTRVSENEAYREGTAIWHSVFEMFANADSKMIMNALKSYKNLQSHDKHTFDNLMVAMTNALESNLAGVDGNVLFDEVNTSVEGLMRRYFAYEGTLEWWQEGKSACEPKVQAWIEQRFSSPDLDYDFWGIRGEEVQ